MQENAKYLPTEMYHVEYMPGVSVECSICHTRVPYVKFSWFRKYKCHFCLKVDLFCDRSNNIQLCTTLEMKSNALTRESYHGEYISEVAGESIIGHPTNTYGDYSEPRIFHNRFA